MGLFVLQHSGISQSPPRLRISPAARIPDAAHTVLGSATASGCRGALQQLPLAPQMHAYRYACVWNLFSFALFLSDRTGQAPLRTMIPLTSHTEIGRPEPAEVEGSRITGGERCPGLPRTPGRVTGRGGEGAWGRGGWDDSTPRPSAEVPPSGPVPAPGRGGG